MASAGISRCVVVLLGSLAYALPVSAIVIVPSSGSGVISFGQTSVDGLDINLAGVVEVTGSLGACSGSLLSDGYSILTAAHCVASSFGGSLATGITAHFDGPSGMVADSVSKVQVDPTYNGASGQGTDLAVLTLSEAAPTYAVRYQLYSGSAIPQGPVLLAGYGFGGTGATGGDSVYGTLRAGFNEYEGPAAQFFAGVTPGLLIGQFYEGGAPSTNALGVTNPYSSSAEVDISGGDSGGPTFYNGAIIGVHDSEICLSLSSGGSCETPPAINSLNNSYFGELFGDTSVAANLRFIQGAEDAAVPEPDTATLLFGGILSVAWLRRRRINLLAV